MSAAGAPLVSKSENTDEGSHHRRLHLSAGLAEDDPLSSHPEEDVDADVDQQSDNKRQVEGHHRGVDHKVWVGDGAHRGVI